MKKKIILLLSCLCIFCSSIEAKANENMELPSLIIEETGNGETANNQYDSVLQIVVTYTNDKGNEIPLQGGSAFLIGNDDEQLQYMITSNEVVSVSDETKKSARKKYKINKDEEIEGQIKAVINKDITIDASIITASEEMDFAILQLSQPLHDRNALYLNDKEASDYLGKTAYALGYPSSVRAGEDMVYYTSVDLQQTKGFLEIEEILNGQKFIRHHIFPNYGNIGGPIIDENQTVVALNQSKNDGKSFYALEITEIMHVMDSLGIPYKTVTQKEKEAAEKAKAEADAKAAALAAIVHKEELEKIIKEAEQIDVSDYKKKSLMGFDECLETIKETYADEEVTQKQVDSAVKDMRQAIDGLVLKTPLKIVVAIISGISLVCIVVILVVLRITRKKRMERRERRKAEFTVTEPAPVFDANAHVLTTSYKDLVEAGNKQVENHNIWNMQLPDEQADEQTTILNSSKNNMDCEDVTCVLNIPSPTLIRCNNGENILVNKFPFILGKDKSKTDYTVQDNMAVSRIHATLLFEGGSYYIQDNNATNGTYLNDNRLASGSKKQLHDNDKICLGNEKFDIRLTNSIRR